METKNEKIRPKPFSSWYSGWHYRERHGKDDTKP